MLCCRGSGKKRAKHYCLEALQKALFLQRDSLPAITKSPHCIPLINAKYIPVLDLTLCNISAGAVNILNCLSLGYFIFRHCHEKDSQLWIRWTYPLLAMKHNKDWKWDVHMLCRTAVMCFVEVVRSLLVWISSYWHLNSKPKKLWSICPSFSVRYSFLHDYLAHSGNILITDFK